MNPVWARLQHLNARALVQVALPVFAAGVLGGVVLALRTDTGLPVPAFALSADTPGAMTNRLPRAWAEVQVDPASPDGPFGSDYLVSFYRFMEAQQAQEAERVAAVAAAAETNAVPPALEVPEAPEEPVPPPPRETVILRYRGSLDRPDGTRLALVEDVKEKGTAFLALQGEMAGFVLEGFDREEAKLSRGGQRIRLPVGEAVELELP